MLLFSLLRRWVNRQSQPSPCGHRSGATRKPSIRLQAEQLEDRCVPALTLTPAGIAAGFGLSTFATGFPISSGLGPLGIAFPSSGGVLVTDGTGNVRLFAADTDGQDASSAAVGQNYGFLNALGLAAVGNNIYMTQFDNGALVQINSDGTLNQNILSGIGELAGIVANPTNGHLFVSNCTFRDYLIVCPDRLIQDAGWVSV